jgi:NADH dehydrogenase
MQEGRYVAGLIENRLKGKGTAPFKYIDKGSLAVIGSSHAVADLGRLHFSGFFAWLVWALIHISYLIEFENRAVVFFRWAWNYFTRKRGVRLITGQDPLPLVKKSRGWKE